MKTVLATVAALLVGAAPSVARAEGPGPGEGQHELHMLLKAANLTAAQRTQVHELMKSSRAQGRTLHEQMEALHTQLMDKLAGAGSVTAADLAPIQQQIAALHGQMQQQHLQNALQIRALLTTDQLRQVSATHEQIKSLHAQMKALLPAPEEMEHFEGPTMQR